jgi:hypothetical protein
VTAQLRVIRGGIADRETVAGFHLAMQDHAAAAKAPPVPAVAKPKLSVVPLGCTRCGDPECKADQLLQDVLRAMSFDDVERDYADPIVRSLWVAYQVHGVACVARQAARMQMLSLGTVRPRPDGKWDEWTTAGWMLADIVRLYVKIRDEYRDVLYKIVPHGGRYIARAVPGQQLTDEEAQQHEEAAIGQWELERSL